MFTEEPNEKQLRQGDVIAGLYYPLMNCKDLNIIGTAKGEEPFQSSNFQLTAVSEEKNGFTQLTAQVKVLRVFAVVISQCCDLEMRSSKLTIPAFAVTPLTPVPYQINSSPEKLATLQENSLESFINLFYVLRHDPLKADHVVDFNRIISLPKAEYEFALSQKVLQMTDKARVQFKMKLSSHFGRPTQEEISANLYPKA